MSRHGRRTFLKLSGGVLGGVFAGSTVTAAERTDRFIVGTNGKRLPSDLDVVHEMPGVQFAVVEGSESEMRRSKAVKSYAADIEVELDDPDVNTGAPTVDEADVNAPSSTASPTDEPYYPLQWDKQALNVPDAHGVTRGAGTRVTVIDTGVAAGHPDLKVNESLSRNFTGDGLGAAVPAGGDHGTHVAGIVAALDNGDGVVGTAPETELVDCRVFSPNALASFGDILAAVVYSAAIGADVANLSLGAYPIPRQGLGSFYGKVLNSVMTYANREGTLLVVAAGNDAADLQHDKNLISLPNEGAQAVSVAATGPIGFGWDADADGETTDFAAPPESPAFYTNYGTNAITLGAPGGDADLDAIGTGVPWYLDLVFNTLAIPTYETDADGDIVGIASVEYTYGWKAGTSMAAPNVAGAAALVKSANPDYNANQAESALKKAAEVPDGYDKAYYGSGFLDIVDAL
ncbi:S8 family serine peptidase [Halobaculum gomorrense]|uniref:Serine protease, subtilisin family n=1 Tax=Halobaculum gomorrense TaxID=43928 RepID=A0A1M5MZ75_9EURY|nr:S8 family serine peptidase [Halobaculum gomorrense]SHG82578.1 Serine protease, subtilisin family [Halobaculum gomorrense]